MKTILIVLSIIVLPFFSSAQDCDCLANYKWVKKTIEENDAGFNWAIQKKGLQKYEAICDSMEQVVSKITDVSECSKTLNEWAKYIRKGHIGVYEKNQAGVASEVDTVSYTKDDILKKQKDSLEGFWANNYYVIGIIKDTANDKRDYVGFIIRTKNNRWHPQQVKMEFFKDSIGYAVNYYMSNHGKKQTRINSLSENKLIVGDFIFKGFDEDIVKNISDFNTDDLFKDQRAPTFKQISDSVLYLNFPSCNPQYKKHIDSIVDNNKKLLTSTKHLIINISQNGGGADKTFQALLPYIYTDTFKTYTIKYLLTPFNKKHIRSNVLPKNPLIRIIAFMMRPRFMWNLRFGNNKYVRLNKKDIVEETYDKVYEYPQKVHVIVSGKTGSAAEMFTLYLKQSSKVTLYGQNTFGAFDASNITRVTTPDGNFTLVYAMSLRVGLAERSIDDIGIEPDIFIDESIPQDKWVDYIIENYIK